MYIKKYLLLAVVTMMAATSAWSETVTTEAELNDALNVFDVDIDVKLGADITLSNYLGITNGKNVTLDLNGHTLKRNLSGANDYGSVIRVSTGSKLTIEDSSGDNSGTITGGRSTYGGGISNHGSLTLMGGTISSNLATGAGGGVYNAPSTVGGTPAQFDMQGGVILGNWGADGGGIYNYRGSSVGISGGVISGNTSNAGGGGLVNYGEAFISGCTIHNNQATTRGGAIWTSGELYLGTATILGNQAKEAGGAIYYDNGSKGDLNSTVITSNSALDGGALYVEQTANIIFYAPEITGNISTLHGGGGITNYGTLDIDGITVTGNTARSNGSGIWNNGTLKMKGDVTVKDNTRDDIYLSSGKITCTGPFADKESVIGVKMDNPGVFTSGYKANNERTMHFFPSGTADRMGLNDSGEGYMTMGYYECHWNGSEVVRTAKAVPTDKPLVDITSGAYDNGGYMDSDHWYYAKGSADIHELITCQGPEVHLILRDDCGVMFHKGIRVVSGTTLHFHSTSYSNRTGGMSAIGTKNNYAGIGSYEGAPCGNIVIHGGDIKGIGGSYGAGIGGGDEADGGTVTIYGGSVQAYGGTDAAGIGGGDTKGNGGTTYIYGGDVTAYGGSEFGAGIGGGDGGNGGTTYIYGGKVNAKGGDFSAGIGGATYGNGGNTYIYGGDVTAKGGKQGAGIGASSHYSGYITETSSHGGNTYISGGTVYAEGGDAAAGIGGAYYTNMADIEIKGGIVTVQGGDGGAGIGGGGANFSGGTLTISGGTVTATGGNGGAGIGGGSANKASYPTGYGFSTLNITGGTVIATGGPSVQNGLNIYYPSAIGAGAHGADHGALDLAGFTHVTAGDDAKTALLTGTDHRVAACRNRYAQVEVIDDDARHANMSYTFNAETHTGSCRNCNFTLVGNHYDNGEGEGKCVCGYYMGVLELALTDLADNGLALAEADGMLANVTYDRTLSATQNSNGSWTSRAYTLCLPYDLDLSKIPGNLLARAYRLAYVKDREYVFTNEFGYLAAGVPYLVVVDEGELKLDASNVVVHSNPSDGYQVFEWSDDPAVSGKEVGLWRGTFDIISNDKAAELKAHTLSKDGKFRRISNAPGYQGAYIGTFRAFFMPYESDGYYAFTTKFVYQENGEEDTEIQDFPADGFEGDNDYTDATTGIGTIHTIDSDGTHRYYDMQGRQLRQRPAKGLYIENGKIQFNK